jgi:hypothetical protein
MPLIRYHLPVPFLLRQVRIRGEIAQLVEQWPEEPRVLGSSPSLATNLFFLTHAGVAQLIERFLAKEEVQGLSPCTRTMTL